MDRPSFAGFNRAWDVAEERVPGWHSITLRLGGGRGPLAFTIDTGSGGRPDQRAQLSVNARTGEVGGWMGETVAAAASLGGAVLVWTGISLALRRLNARRRRNSREKPTAALEETPAAVS